MWPYKEEIGRFSTAVIRQTHHTSDTRGVSGIQDRNGRTNQIDHDDRPMDQMEAFSVGLPHYNQNKPPNTEQNPHAGRIIQENRKIHTADRITDGQMASLGSKFWEVRLTRPGACNLPGFMVPGGHVRVGEVNILGRVLWKRFEVGIPRECRRAYSLGMHFRVAGCVFDTSQIPSEICDSPQNSRSEHHFTRAHAQNS
jgi:hypothetical protein